VTDISFPAALIELEGRAWAEIQAGTLTVDTAQAVHAAVGEYAAEAGMRRIDVELGLKRQVRGAAAG